MKKQLLRANSSRHFRFSCGQICTLLGSIDVVLNECAKSFDPADLRHLVHLHGQLLNKLAIAGPDYVIRDGNIVEARNPQRVIARAGVRNFKRLRLVLSNG